jgi:hypothetical protein
MNWLIALNCFVWGIFIGLNIGASIYRKLLKASMKMNDEYSKLGNDMIDDMKKFIKEVEESINSSVSPSETNITK